MPKGGSQLAQLKSALSSAGLSRQSQPGTSGKKRKRSAADSRDPAAERQDKARRLDEISKKLNPFDVKVTKLKHDIGGRVVKGSIGRPGVSRQEGLEKRKKLLLPELERQNRSGGIVDRRFGESDSTLTVEERMLERFTKERQRSSRGVNFNLDDDEELTHYGQSLSALDDFEGTGLALDDDGDDGVPLPSNAISAPNEEEAEDPDQPPRKKTKAEVMSEVMAKSKEHKHLRQLAKEQDEQIRHDIDKDFGSIRNLLFGQTIDPSSSGSNAVPLGVRAGVQPASADEIKPSGSTPTKISGPAGDGIDDDYDQVVRQLAFDKRAKPTDRTKTEEEIAAEEAVKLEEQERARLQRMHGEEVSEDDGNKHRGAKRRRHAEADDLEDDFGLEAGVSGLGHGLEDTAAISAGEDELDSTSSNGSGLHSEASEFTNSDGDISHDDDALTQLATPTKPAANKVKQKISKTGELPFTFLCPATHEEFLEITEDVNIKDLPIVIQRIRTIYHPSLAEANKFKLQTFCSVLIDHVLYLAGHDCTSMSSVDILTQPIFSLSDQYPIPSATFFVKKLVLMQKNFCKGLEKGALLPDSKTFPGTAELAFLKLIGQIWSTSDFRHPVVSPAMLLMAQYLGQSRIRSLSDVASGLYLCTLAYEFNKLSGRLVPEATNFLFNVLLLLAPHSFERGAIPGSFPSIDFDQRTKLCLKKKPAAFLAHRRANIAEIINDPRETGPVVVQRQLDLLSAVFKLLELFGDLYKELDGFIELFQPVLDVLDGVKVAKLPDELKKEHNDSADVIRRLLKFANEERKPLALQDHKPIPIATYIPKFDDGYSFRKQNGADAERNASSKLRAQYKKEHKGAMRELRKDSRFLAGEQAKKQEEKDAGYKARLARVHGEIQLERAEEKALERQSAKDKRRAGK